MASNDAIRNELSYIELVNDVRIVYACESGSRAWGFDSPDSDFDVRFVYVRPISDYLRLDSVRDTIEWRTAIEKSGKMVDFDSSGWDLPKFLRLMKGSNPSAIEWLGSPTVYSDDSRFYEVKRLRDECFDPVAGAWHYYGMAKSNDFRNLRTDFVPAKKYLYAVRAILAAKWCIARFRPAPIPFCELQRAMLPASLSDSVDELLRIKRSGDENGTVRHFPDLDEWLFDTFDGLPDEIRLYRHHQGVDWDVMNAVFRRVVGL